MMRISQMFFWKNSAAYGNNSEIENFLKFRFKGAAMAKEESEEFDAYNDKSKKEDEDYNDDVKEEEDLDKEDDEDSEEDEGDEE